MLESSSKMMYYPTDVHEIYRMLGVVGRLFISPSEREQLRNMLGETVYFQLLEKGLSSFKTNFASLAYGYLVESRQYNLLHKFFELNIGYSKNQTVTIFDPFAGEAVWLEMFKNSMKKDEINSAKIHLIANEIELNRYKSIVNKGIVDEYYNKSFEELCEIPKYSISLLLFNPPYGDTNGKRNVLHYLEMIIEREIIYKSKDNSDNGKIILVVRKDDLIEILPLLTKHFNVHKELIYKVNKNEYKRYKQFVVYATLKNEPYNEKNINDVARHNQEMEEILHIVNSDPEFDITMIGVNFMQPPSVPYDRLKENHRLLNEQEFEVSVTNGDSWTWVKEMTEIKDIENETIFKPTPIKTGELANYIASGMINGEMDLDGKGNGYHIVVGGTKKQVKQELVQEEDKKGNLVNKTKTLVYTQPYLNILINDKGKVKIKELQGGTELE